MALHEDPDDGDVSRVSRRNLLIGGLAAAGGGALAWHHFAGPSTASGNTLVVAFDGTATTKFAFDPHNSGFAPYNRVIRSIFDNLVVLLPDKTIGPWLAQSWEISPDGTRYLFSLRKGVTFHDGTPFDAAAVKANFDRLHGGSGPPLYSRSCIGPYLRSEVVAPDQVRVVLSEPFTPLLRNLSSTKLGIVSPSAVAKFGAAFAQNPVGTGPFRFAGLTSGTEIRLERNPAYQWAPATAAHQGPALLERLTFRNVPVEATRVAVLQSGQAQVADLIPPQDLPAIRGDAQFRLLEKELLETNYALALNTAKAPWNDREIRQAVRLSLDIDALVKVIYLGQLRRAWSPLTPTMFGSAEPDLTGSWHGDPARAAAILDAKGWKKGADGIREKDGQRLDISFLDTQGNREKRLDVIQLARRQLADNGIGLHIDSQPSGAWLEKLKAGAYDMTAGASFHADPDILSLSFLPARRSALSGNRVDDPDLARWLDQASRIPDGPARAELYKQVQRKIVDEVYLIPIYVLNYNIAVSRQVEGIAIDSHGFPEFHGARLV